MQKTQTEKEREAIRRGYHYSQDLAFHVAHEYPEVEQVNIREQIIWVVRQVAENPQERVELLPYVTFGFYRGTLDELYLQTNMVSYALAEKY